ncbi:MAG: hypothetical protein WC294_09570 [Methanoregula sp.]|jgi:hypothetical protein
MIDLKPFYQNPINEVLSKPWSRGGYTFATDGRIAIRVPEIESVPDNPNAPDVMKIWPKEPGEYIALPENIPPVTVDPCPWCCDYEKDAVCEECNGTGFIEKAEFVRVGPTLYSNIYLNMIKDLPSLKFGSRVVKKGDRRPTPAIFKFDGGEGLLMPIFE